MGREKRKESGGEQELRFDAGMEKLEGIVTRLESGELPLEEALEAFEIGVGLVRVLNEKLSAAEKRVEILSRAEDGTLQLTAAEIEEP